MNLDLIKKFTQLIKFSFVGGINTLTSLVIYYVMVYLGIDFMISTVVSYLTSSVVGYILNRYWVFNAKKTKLHNSVFKYYIVYGSSLLINMGCMYLWVNIMAISTTIAPILTLCITIPYNYVLSKLWTFKEKQN